MSKEALVVGIGNPDCGDDGIGPLVAERLVALTGARVIVRSGDVLGLIEDWSDAGTVVLIDAASSACDPGHIHRLELSDEHSSAACPAYRGSLSSTHGLGVAQAIDLARALERLPKRIIVYAIEGKNFAPGAAMTAEVRASAETVADRVSAEVRQLHSSN